MASAPPVSVVMNGGSPPNTMKSADPDTTAPEPGSHGGGDARGPGPWRMRLTLLLPLLALVAGAVAGSWLAPISTPFGPAWTEPSSEQPATLVLINRPLDDPDAIDAIAAALANLGVTEQSMALAVRAFAAADRPPLRLGDAVRLPLPDGAPLVLLANTTLDGAGFPGPATAAASTPDSAPPGPQTPTTPQAQAPTVETAPTGKGDFDATQRAPAQQTQQPQSLAPQTVVPQQQDGASARLYATAPTLLASSVAAGWLQAAQSGASTLTILQIALPGAPVALPKAQFQAGVWQAGALVYPYVHDLSVTPVEAEEMLMDRDSAYRLVIRRLPAEIATALPATSQTPLWRRPFDALAATLPPAGLTAALTPGVPLAAAERPAIRDDGTIDAAWVNPIISVLEAGPTRSWVPAGAALAALYLGAAVLLGASRQRPDRARRIRGFLAAASLTAGAIGLTLGVDPDWVGVVGARPGDGAVPAISLLLALVAVTPALSAPLLFRVPLWDGERSAGPGSDPADETTQKPDTAALRAVLHRDLPTADDALGFARIAHALADFLDHRNTRPPVVLAVNGPWGSGKSSIMKMVQVRLEPTRRFNVVWFNAWRYRHRDEILHAFLVSMSSHLSERWTPLAALRLAGARLRRASLGQLLMLSMPVLVAGTALIALLVPDTAALAEALARLPLAAGSTDAVAAPLAAVGAGGLLRYLLPFRRPILRLFALNAAKRQMNLEDFEREFALYREAIGRRKVLVVVDDLDRCEPDAVVEVLRSINLIVSSTEQGGCATYFMLGFDAEYIVRSVELHFDKHSVLADQRGDSFGRQYLKKIVTLGVSVPQATPDALAKLAERAGRRAGGPAAQPDWGTWLHAKLAAHRPLLQNLSLCAAAMAGLLLLALNLAEPEPPAATDPDPAATAAVQSDPAPRVDPPDESNGTAALQPVRLSAPNETATDMLPGSASGTAWSVLLAALAAAVLVYLLGKVEALATPVPSEPDDSPEFDAAVRQHAGLLPGNPRDLIRTLNLMRVIHRIQSPLEDGGASPALFDGPPMPAEDVVVLTALQQRFPTLLSTEMLAERLVPAAEHTRPGPQVFAGLDDPRRDELTTLLNARPESWSALTRDSLARFLQVSRNILQTGTVGPSRAAAARPSPDRPVGTDRAGAEPIA
jgi:hypothetical protein